MRCSEPLTTCAQGSEQFSSNVLLNSWKTKLYLRESLRVCDSLTHLLVTAAAAEKRAWELLPFINTEHGASCPRCAFLVCIKAEEREASKQAAKNSPAKKKRRKKARWVPRGWEMGWMTIDWLSTLICIRISFWPDKLSWQAATALTYEDVVYRPCSELWFAKLCSHAVFTCVSH